MDESINNKDQSTSKVPEEVLDEAEKKMKGVKDGMEKNIDSIISRGEGLEEIQDRAQALENTAFEFMERADEMKEKIRKRLLLFRLFVSFFLVAFLFFVVCIFPCFILCCPFCLLGVLYFNIKGFKDIDGNEDEKKPILTYENLL